MVSLFDGSSQDQEDFTIFCLEFFVKPAQLAGVTPALHSIVFPDEKQIDIFPGAEVSQVNFGSVAGREAEVRSQRADGDARQIAHTTSQGSTNNITTIILIVS